MLQLRGRKEGKKKQSFGHFRGGFSAKIHMSRDKKGRVKHFILSPSEQSDDCQALSLLREQQTEKVLADKGYEADYGELIP
jgi:IS5 family transposase